MPGLVTTFLRNPSGNIKKASSSRPRHGSPDISDNEDGDSHGHQGHHHHHLHAVKMPDLADALKSHRRLPLPFIRKDAQCPALKLDWRIESPPIIFHGTPNDSTGALVSGQMVLDVTQDALELEAFTAALSIRITHKRPFQNHCPECQSQRTELKSWNFIAHPTVLRRGRHLIPFSALLDGHLPASMSTAFMSIAYEFKAVATVAASSLPPSAPVNTTRLDRTLTVKRSVPQPDHPKQSIRLFPPTNIKSTVTYPTVIHPTSANRVTLKLDGLMALNEDTRTLDIWRLKKITWKLEETTKTIAPACARHSPSAESHELPAPPARADAADDESEGPQTRKGVVRSEVRLLGEKSMHEGWKSDYSGSDGNADIEFDYMINQRHRNGDLKYACDSSSRDGTQVTHSLLVELVVSKEFAPEGRPHQAGQTGTGRILRMHFPIVVTEHSGLGVSWDEEAPPVYQDVPPSPPSYEVLDPPIEYEDLEFLDARRASGEPSSRRGSQS